MNKEKILEEVLNAKTEKYEVMNHNKSELVKLANFLRQHDLKCDIKEVDPFVFNKLYKLIITK